MGAPTAGAPRPPRRQPTHTAHATLPSRPPRRQPPPTAGRRAAEPAAAQRGLDHRAVHPYRQHRCTPMHQDGPSVSAKTRGRAVAYPPDVVTLASHRTAGNDQPTPNPARHHDQPTMTRPSSRRLAVNTPPRGRGAGRRRTRSGSAAPRRGPAAAARRPPPLDGQQPGGWCWRGGLGVGVRAGPRGLDGPFDQPGRHYAGHPQLDVDAGLVEPVLEPEMGLPEHRAGARPGAAARPGWPTTPHPRPGPRPGEAGPGSGGRRRRAVGGSAVSTTATRAPSRRP